MNRRLHNERALTAALLRITRAYRRETDRALMNLGVSDARLLPVMYIGRLGEGVRQGALAEALGVEGPSLVRILDQLGVAGFIERRIDPNDRRAKTLHLTAAGRRLAAAAEAQLDDFRRELLARVSDGDLAATLRTFDRFQAALEAAPRRPRSAEG